MKTRTKSGYQFSSHSTYVISGGLGGLGRSLARWMVHKGARYLILLSRSGPKTSEAYKLVRELEEQGATVTTPRVDVTNLSMLRQVLAELSCSMPPIRGCIQGTMVLRVSFDSPALAPRCLQREILIKPYRTNFSRI